MTMPGSNPAAGQSAKPAEKKDVEKPQEQSEPAEDDAI